MLNIALFGAPGAGKGTQSQNLIKKYDLVYIATGEILRQEIVENSRLGRQAKDIIEKGGLVSDEIIVQIIEKKIRQNPNASGFLFDGFPRTFVQAYILEGLLLKMHTSLTCLMSLNLPQEECVKRILKRGETSGRVDDTREVIENRLKEYEKKTLPVAQFYKEKGIYVPIDGIGEIDEVFDRLAIKIKSILRRVLLNVVLLGYPGAGRGTQAKMVAKKYDLTYLSMAKILQKAVAEGSLPEGITDRMEEGKLIDDEIVIKLIEKTIKSKESEETNGFVFKGFPRTIVQAYILDGLLRKANTSLSCIIDLKVPTLQVIRRLADRSKTEKARAYDSSTEAILRRLEDYEMQTLPVNKYYSQERNILSVDGVGTTDEVFERVDEVVNQAKRNKWRLLF